MKVDQRLHRGGGGHGYGLDCGNFNFLDLTVGKRDFKQVAAVSFNLRIDGDSVDWIVFSWLDGIVWGSLREYSDDVYPLAPGFVFEDKHALGKFGFQIFAGKANFDEIFCGL